jgi:uncharacterized protein YuzE
MVSKLLAIWYDPEGDFLEVTFDQSTPGYYSETDDDRVMQRVDAEGRVLGFSVLGVRQLTNPTLFALAHGTAVSGE